MNKCKTDGSRPTISVIVPVYNDPEGLEDTLPTLVDQNYPPDKYEVVVVNNNSDDRTPEVIDRFARDYPEMVVRVDEPEQGINSARNAGLDVARGEIVGFIDADMKAPSDWLRKLDAKFDDESVHYVGCRVVNFGGEKSLIGEFTTRTAFRVKKQITEEHFAPGCSLVVSRELVRQIGKFDGNLNSGGDREFGNRAREHGFELHYAPDIAVYHPARTRLSSLLSQSMRFGQGDCQYIAQDYDYGDEKGYEVRNPLDVVRSHIDLLRDRIRGWDELTAGKKGAFYGVASLVYSARLAGYWSEKARRALNRFLPPNP